MWLQVISLTLCTVYSAVSEGPQLVPKQSVFSMLEGSSLQVNCTGDSTVGWTKEKGALPPSSQTNRAIPETGQTISILTLKDLVDSFEGTYFCTESDTGESSTFELKVFTVTIRNATFEYKVDAMLDCSFHDSDVKTFHYSWKKGNTSVGDLAVEGKQAFVPHENGSLEIIHPARRLAGNYTCVADYERSSFVSTITIDVPYYATPKVLPFDKSKNLMQDENLEVECKVLGYPKPSITWQKGGKEIKKEDTRYTLSSADTYDGQPIDNARLYIKSVDFDDAGEYKCIARQQNMWGDYNSTQIILVRVKDKLAALWPFLGIVAEVVILCAIIFIYEKKRNKDAIMEDDDDDNGAPPEKSGSVRHRGNTTNNPRA